jgi:hypothetical protein
MKVEILTPNIIKNLVKETNDKQSNLIYSEIEKLRIRINVLEESIKIMGGKHGKTKRYLQ